jgi:hypothetical protein
MQTLGLQRNMRWKVSWIVMQGHINPNCTESAYRAYILIEDHAVIIIHMLQHTIYRSYTQRATQMWMNWIYWPCFDSAATVACMQSPCSSIKSRTFRRALRAVELISGRLLACCICIYGPINSFAHHAEEFGTCTV